MKSWKNCGFLFKHLGVGDHHHEGASPSLLQYGINLPFRFAVIGQTDSGKTHSIVRRWLGGKIQYCKYFNGKLTNAYL